MTDMIVHAVSLAWIATGAGLFGLTFILGGFKGEFEDTPITTCLVILALCSLLWPTVLYRLVADQMDDCYRL